MSTPLSNDLLWNEALGSTYHWIQISTGVLPMSHVSSLPSLDSLIATSEELDQIAEQALRSLEGRQNEDVASWARRLAGDVYREND
jgi:hypothetical protein